MNKKLKFKKNVNNKNLNLENQIAHSNFFSNKYLLFYFCTISFLTFLFYLKTLSQYILGGDSGEMTMAGCTWGIAHPPGFPLYTILTNLFCMIPVGNVVQRVSAISAISSSFATGFIGLTLLYCTKSLISSLFGCLLFFTLPLIWTYSIQPEVFALNNLFLSILLFVSTKFIFELNYKKKDSLSFLYSFIFGLGLSNHQILLLIGLPIFTWIAFSRDNKNKVKMGLFFILGLTPYIYLPLISLKNPFIQWGNSTELLGFLKHVLRSEYGTFKLGVSNHLSELNSDFFNRIMFFLNFSFKELGIMGSFFFFINFFWKKFSFLPYSSESKHTNKILKIWLLSSLFYILIFSVLSNLSLKIPLIVTVQKRFIQQPLLIFSFISAIGFNMFHLFLNQKFGLKKKSKVFIGTVIFGFIIIQGFYQFEKQSFKNNPIFENFGKSVLNSLPPGSLLIVQGDHVVYTLRYLQKFKNIRTDVIALDENMLAQSWKKKWVASHFPQIILPQSEFYGLKGYQMKEFFDLNFNSFPIFIVNGLLSWDRSFQNYYSLMPYGFSKQVLMKNQEMDLGHWFYINKTIFLSFKDLLNQPIQDGSWEKLVYDDYKRELEQFVLMVDQYKNNHKFSLQISNDYNQFLKEIKFTENSKKYIF